jgi:hypothetical protein
MKSVFVPLVLAASACAQLVTTTYPWAVSTTLVVRYSQKGGSGILGGTVVSDQVLDGWRCRQPRHCLAGPFAYARRLPSSHQQSEAPPGPAAGSCIASSSYRRSV